MTSCDGRAPSSSSILLRRPARYHCNHTSTHLVHCDIFPSIYTRYRIRISTTRPSPRQSEKHDKDDGRPTQLWGKVTLSSLKRTTRPTSANVSTIRAHMSCHELTCRLVHPTRSPRRPRQPRQSVGRDPRTRCFCAICGCPGD